MAGYAAWNQFESYATGDVVNYAGFNYVAASNNINVPPFPVTPAWTLIPSGGGGGGGGLTNPLTTNLDLGGNQIVNSTVVETEFITKPAGSLAPSIEVQEPMTFTSINPTIFNATPPQTAVAPSVGDDLTNKSYVDSIAGNSYGAWIFGNENNPSEWAQSPGFPTMDININATPFNPGGIDWLNTVIALYSVPAFSQKIIVSLVQPVSGASQTFRSGVSPPTQVPGDPFYTWTLTALTPSPLWTLGEETIFTYTIEGPAPSGNTAAYGNFLSLGTQSFAPSPGVALQLGVDAGSSQVLNVGSTVVPQKAGVYSMTFSAQIVGGANEQVLVYFSLNGTPIADSGSYIDVKNGETEMLTVNYISSLAVNDVIEVYGVSPSGLSAIANVALGPPLPGAPSLIFTIQELVGQGPQGPPGPAGGITNPLTADLLAGGFSIQNAGTVQTNFLTLPSVGANPAIDVSSPIVFTDPTLPAQFTIPPQTSVAPTVGNDLCNKTYVDGLTGGISLPGLYNFLRIVPTAAGQTVSSVYYTGGSGVGTPSPWVPDATPNTLIAPVAGTSNEWRLTKPASPAGAASRWWAWPYNLYPAPTYAANAAPAVPSVPIIKKNLNALYAIIRVKSTVNITTQGALFFNIYTYDHSTPPAGAYTTRFDYQANNLALPYTTGALNFQSGFTYLVYAMDAEKIVASSAVPPLGGAASTITQANAQTPGQLTSEMLRDPYDIHTDLPHIPLSAVAYALGSVVPSDINNVPVSGIAFGCPSNAITNGSDIELIAVGYRANGGTINEEYLLQFA